MTARMRRTRNKEKLRPQRQETESDKAKSAGAVIDFRIVNLCNFRTSQPIVSYSCYLFVKLKYLNLLAEQACDRSCRKCTVQSLGDEH